MWMLRDVPLTLEAVRLSDVRVGLDPDSGTSIAMVDA